jgi:hypothetical protein
MVVWWSDDTFYVYIYCKTPSLNIIDGCRVMGCKGRVSLLPGLGTPLLATSLEMVTPQNQSLNRDIFEVFRGMCIKQFIWCLACVGTECCICLVMRSPCSSKEWRSSYRTKVLGGE